MAEVAQTRIPDKAELNAKFDEVFGSDDTLWEEPVAEAAGEPAEEVVEPVEEVEQEAAPVDETPVEEPEVDNEIEATADEATRAVVDAKPSGKKDAQSRIRALAAEKNQLREELQRTQQYFNQQLEQVKQQSLAEARAQREMQQQAFELQRQQFQLFQGDREAAEFEKLPLDKKIEMRARRESEQRLQQQLEARDRHWQSRFDALEQAKLAERQEAERQKRMGGLDTQAEAALDNIVLKGLSPEHAKSLKPQMKEMLMSWCGAYGEYPSEAAPRFAKYIDNMFAAKLQTKRNPNLKKVAAPIAGRAPVVGTKPGAKAPVGKRTIAEALKQRGLRGPLEDLTDELFGRD